MLERLKAARWEIKEYYGTTTLGSRVADGVYETMLDGLELRELQRKNIPPLLKWIGNKNRVAHEIISYFPRHYGTYYEPFLGSGAVLGALASSRAVASDGLKPLIEIWQTLARTPDELLIWYRTRWERFQKNRHEVYEEIKARYNRDPNPADLLFLSRTCYGGVIRFRKDGYMSTPIGIHEPIPPEAMAERIAIWHERTLGTRFIWSSSEDTIDQAKAGDLVYCDPPYSDTQRILYGAQEFSLERLFKTIERAKERRVRVALSIDGHKKSGLKMCDVPIPAEIFPQIVFINCGRSMLRRFQIEGKSLDAEVVSDRLALTW